MMHRALDTKRTLATCLVLLAVPFSVSLETVRNVPYQLLTGYSRVEIERMAYMDGDELEARAGIREVPGGFTGTQAYQGRAAHALASYLGTKRWGPDITLAAGYLREVVPWLLWQREADPVDIVANYAGVAEALRERERAP